MIRASILATAGDSMTMIRLFQEITDPERVRPLRRAIEFLAANRFPWNTTYIATATPGQRYAGKLVGRDGAAFMMRTDSDQIIIGQQADIPADIRSSEHFSFMHAISDPDPLAGALYVNLMLLRGRFCPKGEGKAVAQHQLDLAPRCPA